MSATPNLCPECGALIEAESSHGGLCTACLLVEGQRSAELETLPLTTPFGDREHQPRLSSSNVPLTEVIGPYRLLSLLGEGGMGRVYSAEQSKPIRRKVALKVVKPGMDSKEVLARFEAERQALALMDHPGIARVYEAGTTPEGRPYFAMELVEGESLTRYCDRTRLKVRDRLALFLMICEAVQHAHQKGVIHRDLKPANILVEERNGKPFPKVIDFGIAKALEANLTDGTLFTELGQLVGTPEYMSPEQAALDPGGIDTRTDVFSLGVILYELLVGEPPVSAKILRRSGLEKMLEILREFEPPCPSIKLGSLEAETAAAVSARRDTGTQKLQSALRGDLDWIVMRAIEKVTAQRYQTVGGLAEDVVRFLRNEPVSAGPPSAFYRLRKFTRRNRGTVVAVGAVAISLLAGSIVSTNQAIRAKSAEGIALEEARRANEVIRDAMEKSWGSARIAFEKDNDPSAGMAHFAESIRYLSRLPGEMRNPTILADAAVRLMDLPTQPRILRHKYYVSDAFFTHDGTKVVTIGLDKSKRIWDAKTGSPIGTDGAPDPSDLNTSDFAEDWTASPDQNWVLSSPGNRRVELSLASNQDKCIETLEHDYLVKKATFSPDGSQILTVLDSFGELADNQPVACLWDMPSGVSRGFPIRLEEGMVVTDISPCGTRIVVAGLNGGENVIRVLELPTMKPVLAQLRSEFSIEAARFSPCGRWILTEHLDKTVTLWDASSGKTIFHSVSHDTEIQPAAFSPESDRLLVIHSNAVEIIEAETGARRHRFSPEKAEFTGARFGRDRGEVILSSSDGLERVFDLDSGEAVSPPVKRGWANSPTVFSLDGKRAASLIDPMSIQLWDVASGDVIASPIRHDAAVHDFKFSPSSNWLIICCHDWSARLWDSETGDPLGNIMKHRGPVKSAVFSKDSKWVVTASDDATARIWQAPTGFPIGGVLSHRDNVWGGAISPDNRWVATASRDGTVRVWEFCPDQYSFAGEELLRLLPSCLESSGKTRINLMGIEESVSVQGFPAEVDALLNGLDRDTSWGKLLNWGTMNRQKRSLSPQIPMTPDDVTRSAGA